MKEEAKRAVCHTCQPPPVGFISLISTPSPGDEEADNRGRWDAPALGVTIAELKWVASPG